MSAHNEIAGILEQWLQLTQAESTVIESADWPALAQIQARKASLQESLVEARNPGNADLKPWRSNVGRIISLLTRNAEVLAAKMRLARARRKLLADAGRNLRRIQQSYVRPRPPKAWQSYS